MFFRNRNGNEVLVEADPFEISQDGEVVVEVVFKTGRTFKFRFGYRPDAEEFVEEINGDWISGITNRVYRIAGKTLLAHFNNIDFVHVVEK
jgi:hypothetical protein